MLNAYEYIMEFTDTYKKYGDAPRAIREAKCVEVQTRYWFQPMREEDLLAGRFLIAEVGYCSEPLLGRSVSYFYDPQRIDALLHSDRYTEKQKQDIREALAFWKEEETRHKTRARFPEYMKQALPEDIYWEHSEVAFPLYRIVDAYMDYEKLMRLGLDGLKAEACRYREKAEREGGGTALFALLALAGDVGCMAGPSAVGAVADAFSGDLHIGIAFGLFFPVLMAVVLLAYSIRKRRKKSLLTGENLQ